MLRHAFADLQRDISDEPVANDHIHRAVENVAPFDVPRKIQPETFRRLYASRVSSLPLVSSSPIDSKPLWPPRAEDCPVVDFAHHRKLHQMRGLGIHVRADIEQYGRAALRSRKGAASATRSTEDSVPSPNRATAITAPVFPALTMASAWPARTSLAATCAELSFFFRKACEGESCIVMTSVAGTISMGSPRCECFASSFLFPPQGPRGGFEHAKLARRLHCALHFRTRRMVSTHCIYGYGDHSRLR
jgi:hypothetical protein